MGLLLICPHCRAKMPLPSRICLACGADLRDLPPADRRYFIGKPASAEAAPSALGRLPGPNPETVAAELMDPYPETLMPAAPLPGSRDVSLCEALDRILNRGAVLFGEVMISVADIDLVYLGLQVILASMETARGFKPRGEGQLEPNLFTRGAC